MRASSSGKSKMRHGEGFAPAPRLRPKKTWVVAYRRNYNVHRVDLTQPAYELLSALASGTTVGDAIVSVMTRKWRPAVKQKQLFEWFRDWMAEGLFQAVEVAPPPSAISR